MSFASAGISANVFVFDVKCTFMFALIHSSNPLRSFGVRAQSSGSSVRILVRSTGGCGGFFFSCRFWNTTGSGSGIDPSEDETLADGGLGNSSGGGGGGTGAARNAPATRKEPIKKATRRR